MRAFLATVLVILKYGQGRHLSWNSPLLTTTPMGGCLNSTDLMCIVPLQDYPYRKEARSIVLVLCYRICSPPSKKALATELTSTLSTLLTKRLRLGNGQPTYRHGTGTSRIARNATRTLSPQITPCERLKYNKAQLAKMETFRRCKRPALTH
ncbi:hypothetical protein TNCV_4226881 [Trichonephila clavipes]|nr:hypothetical protein TNCV_4226881 [Trichonephila clavipes]